MNNNAEMVPIKDIPITEKFLGALMNTPTIPKRFKTSQTGYTDLLATIKYGEELGVGPFTSMYQIYLVNGQGSMQGQLMLAKVWAAGHKVKVEVDELQSKVTCWRKMDDEMVEVGDFTFTVEDAVRADLMDKGTYESYIKHMLSWRAVSFACRIYYPDLFTGPAYHPSELGHDEYPEALPEYVEVDGDIDLEVAGINVENILEAEVVDG